MNDQQDQVNNKKLFVGNLPYSATQDQLSSIFAEFGEVTSVSLITDKMSGRSKGFAFVEYATEEAAQAAIEGMKEQKIDDRDVVINVARPRKPREFGGGGGFDNRGGGGNRSFGNRRDDRRF
jgi:cold-inducible RNA-binding protein